MPPEDTSYFEDLRGGSTRYPNHVDRQYQRYLDDILTSGVESSDRTGTGTIKTFGRQMRFDLKKGFPLLTSKATWFEGIKRELLWFLRGQTNIWHLLQHGVTIWTNDAYRRYADVVEEPYEKQNFEQFVAAGSSLSENSFAQEWGDLGPIYGKQWRNFGAGEGPGTDQIQSLIEGLTSNPMSRRHVVSAWNPGDLPESALPPCHYAFQCYVERRGGDLHLSLKWTQRSVDSFLGLPFNIASYGLLAHMLADIAGMEPDELIFSGGDCHLYKSHVQQAQELLGRTPRANLPELSLPAPPPDPAGYEASEISIHGYDPHPSIEAPLEC